MSDQDKTNNGNLVPAGGRNLAPIPVANPLVSRGIAALGQMQELSAAKKLSEDLRQRMLSLRQRSAAHSAVLKKVGALQGDYDKAMRHYDEAIRLNPKDAWAYSVRAYVWSLKKNYDKAIQDYGEAIRLSPNEASHYQNRAHAWEQKENYENAIKDYEQAIRLPNNHWAYGPFARLLATCPDETVRHGRHAIQLATKACQLTGKDGWNLDTLAAAYAESGQFDKGVHYQRKALEQAWVEYRDIPVDVDKAVDYQMRALLRGRVEFRDIPVEFEKYRQRLELYKKKIPYRQNT